MKITKLLFLTLFLTSITSCYQDTGDFFRTESIKIIADSNEKRPGQSILFTITTDSGLNITNDATIYIREENSQEQQQLPDNITTITSPNNITYIVYAQYKEFRNDESFKEYRSEEIKVKFDKNAESFVKRVLIEDYTGAWCVSCPRVSYAIDLLKQDQVNVVPVAIHRGNSPASFDPYNFEGAIPLEQLVNFIGEYPTGKLNRMTQWAYAQNSANNQDVAKQLTQGNPVSLGLAISSTLNGQNLNLDVRVKFLDDYSSTKLVVYVLENNLIYPQKNNTPFYGGLSLIPNFKHDHVVRTTFTNILGDAIPVSESSYGKIYTRNFSLAIPSNIENPSNIEFVAFVVGPDNKSINVRSAVIGDNQVEFEEN